MSPPCCWSLGTGQPQAGPLSRPSPAFCLGPARAAARRWAAPALPRNARQRRRRRVPGAGEGRRRGADRARRRPERLARRTASRNERDGAQQQGEGEEGREGGCLPVSRQPLGTLPPPTHIHFFCCLPRPGMAGTCLRGGGCHGGGAARLGPAAAEPPRGGGRDNGSLLCGPEPPLPACNARAVSALALGPWRLWRRVFARPSSSVGGVLRAPGGCSGSAFL